MMCVVHTVCIHTNCTTVVLQTVVLPYTGIYNRYNIPGIVYVPDRYTFRQFDFITIRAALMKLYHFVCVCFLAN